MLSKVYSAALVGLDAQLVEVEVDLSAGLFNFLIVGLPDAAVKESKERVFSAIKNSGFVSPLKSRRRIIVNLAPANLKKEDPSYDLPIALAFLFSTGQMEANELDQCLFIGELSLEGILRPVKGILPVVLTAKEKGLKKVFLPFENANEASLVKGIEIIPLRHLKDLSEYLKTGEIRFSVPKANNRKSGQQISPVDMAHIKGQEQAKRALEIAAAGAHNVLMRGPAGTGKTILAQSFSSILPPLKDDEILEATKIFSIAGLLPLDQPVVEERPFRSPHHTSSSVALVGGGPHLRPGEITLAHRGVLFLDELPEFRRDVLECLRQPLENGLIVVSRAKGSLVFPAKFILIGAMNPCPCGKLGDPKQECSCLPGQISKYQRKISGPLLDRIDLHIEVPRLSYAKISSAKEAESSAIIKKRVEAARKAQERRFEKEKNIATNSEMDIIQVKKYCSIDLAAQNLLKKATDQMNLSVRSYYRLLKISRTIADLAGAPNIEVEHLAEAIQYRPKELEF